MSQDEAVFEPLDMKPHGPKVMTPIVLTWSPEHMEVARQFRLAREAALLNRHK